MRPVLYLFVAIAITSCVFDGGSEDIIGEYSIGWIDIGCTSKIYYGPIGQMEGQVYEYGWDNKYILAKRHPKCDKKLTDYFIIDMEENWKSKKPHAKTSKSSPCYDCRLGVHGPFDENTYLSKREDLGVPKGLDFTNEY